MLGRVFKAYDIRGVYPDPLTDQMAWQIGYGCAKFLLADAESAGETTPMMKNVLVGRDMRQSSPTLADQLIAGLTNGGASVIDIGLVDGFGRLPKALAAVLRFSQNGFMHGYAIRMIGGVALAAVIAAVLALR